VLILSNSSREEDKIQARRMGAAGYHVKANLSLKELAAEVAQITSRDDRTR
jgi:DNA-binding response OmpR family regulator